MKSRGEIDTAIRRVIADVRPYTMVPDNGLTDTMNLTLAAIEAGIPGDIVECGTWLGGASFAMMLIQQYVYGEVKRRSWMYDSFQGMSPPTEDDGPTAEFWMNRAQSGVKDPDGQNFCIAPLDQVMEGIKRFKLGDHVTVIPGWFNDTLPNGVKPEQIALLRVDCDWYDPVMCVYREMEPLCQIGTPIIIDDYDAWVGCRLATHDYLAYHRLAWRIRSAPHQHGAWMIKEDFDKGVVAPEGYNTQVSSPETTVVNPGAA